MRAKRKVPDYDVLAPFPGVHKTLRDGEAALAQLAERRPCNAKVESSILSRGSESI
jgi:hypothetical protein